MTTLRIDVLAYWLITLCTTLACGQSFDRLLPPRSPRATSSPAYRARAENAHRAVQSLRPNYDYHSLRDEVYRNYRDELGAAVRPAGPSRNLPPAAFERARADQTRFSNDFDRRLTDAELRARARYERYRELDNRRDALRGDRDVRQEIAPGGCQGGSCQHEHGPIRPISHDDSGCDYYGGGDVGHGPRDARDWRDHRAGWNDYGVAHTSCDAPFARPPRGPADYRNTRHNVDRSGNYIQDNLFGDPRVFNPDQPVRNLFRYIFP